MNVSPAFYGHLVKLLSGLAHGKVAVCLEGGYFLPSLAEGVARTLMGLIDLPCDKMKPLRPPHQTVINMINNLRYRLRPHWNCFRVQGPVIGEEYVPESKYWGIPDIPPYETRNCYPTNTPEDIIRFTQIIEDFKTGKLFFN